MLLTFSKFLAEILLILLVSVATTSIGASLPDAASTPGDLLWLDEQADPQPTSRVLSSLTNQLGSNRTSQILSLVGSEIWTYYTYLAARDSALYALSANGIEVFDVTNPSKPIRRFKLPIPGVQVYSFMALSGNYLYVASVDGLVTIDISNQFSPYKVSHLPLAGILMEIEIHGDRCYVGVGRYSSDVSTGTPGWYALSLTNPASPAILGSYMPSTQHKDCRRFDISGNLVFATTYWDSTIEVFDISDPSTPQFVAGRKFSHIQKDVSLVGNMLHLLGTTSILIWDVSNPSNFDYMSSALSPNSTAMARSGSVLFALDYYSGRIQTFDISVPGEITPLGLYQSRANHFSLGFADSLLLIPELNFGFQLVDISNPSAPSLLSEYSPPTLSMLGVAADSSYAYITDNVSYLGGTGEVSRKGILVVDVSNPTEPKYIRTTEIVDGNPRDPLLYDSLVIVNQCQPSRIYSVSDPENPVFLSQFPETWSQTWESTISNGFLVTASSGIKIGDISNPAAPTMLLNQSFNGLTPLSIVVDSGIAYMGGYYVDGSAPDCFLQIVDINFMDSPAMLAMISLEDTSLPLSYRLPEQLVKHGNYLYVAGKWAGMKVIDVSSPKSPILVNTVLSGQVSFLDFAARDQLLFAATSQAVMVFDLLNPAAPVLLESIPLLAVPQRLDVVGDLLHVGCNYGYWIFRITTPAVNCGDADGNGLITISDAVYLIEFIFSSGPAPIPLLSGDANADQFVSISDVVYLINFIFAGGPPPCAQ